MRIFRNVFRRKMRAFLIIFAITIGVFTLVVMGSMAEKINLMVAGGTGYYSNKLVITDASTPTGGCSTTPIAVNRIQEIEDVLGVARASASIRSIDPGRQRPILDLCGERVILPIIGLGRP